MKPAIASVLCAATLLSGCGKKAEFDGAAAGAHGRYVGVGHFPPGRMWSQIVRADAVNNPVAARPADDEQVIIVMDSTTGEVRQCGNLSGRCIAMDPWAKPLGTSQSAPLPLGKHAQDLDAEDAARQQKTPASGR